MYDDLLDTYEADVKKYNDAVKKVDTELADTERVIGEKRGPRGNRETSLTEIPPKPTPPTKIAAYDGVDISDTTTVTTTMYSGWGMPTGGVLSGNTYKYGMHKTFGFLGQGAEVDGPALTEYDASATECKDRYMAINIVPIAASGSISTTLKAKKLDGEKPTTGTAYDLTITADEKKVATPTAAKASPFLQMDGAMSLMAATTASAALVAASLF